MRELKAFPPMKIPSIKAVAAILIATGCSFSQAGEEVPPREKQFKGVELFARFDKDRNQWLFGMLPGTNREKEAEEVNRSMTLTGLDSLLAEMGKLAPQESVFVASPGRGGIAEDVALTALDEETQKALITFCARHEIVLTGEGALLEMPNRTIGAMEASATRRELILSETILDSKGLAMIAEKFPALETLVLTYSGITDADLTPLGKLESLQTLEMNDLYGMTGETFGFVADLKKLRRLNLEQCVALTDKAVTGIAKSPTLESLNLGSCRTLTAACAADLAGMTSLKELNLAGVGLADTAIKDLVKIQSLTSLDIATSQISDESLASIATMPNLKRLGLRACRSITLKGVSSLAPLRLDYIELMVDGTEDAPVDDNELMEFAKKTWPGCEVWTPKQHFKP
jgi:Leucine Rich repeat